MDKEIKEQELQEIPKRKFFSRSGLIGIGFMLLIIAGWQLFPALMRSHEHGHIPQDNYLKQWGLIFKMYAAESAGKQYPPLTPYNDLWVPDLNVIYPEYLTDPGIIIDPQIQKNIPEEVYGDSSGGYYFEIEKGMRLMAQHYVYPGWVVQNASDVELMRLLRLGRGGIEEKNNHLRRIREGVEQFLITDVNHPSASVMAQSKIPLMVARPRPESYHGCGSGCGCASFIDKSFPDKSQPLFIPVLFMDGHVERIPLDEAPDHIKALLELFPEEFVD